MRLIDADELIRRMAKRLSEVKPDESMSLTNEFSEYNLHQVMCGTINECIQMAIESPRVSVEVWSGYHGDCLQPKGSFDKLFNGEEEEDEDDGI